MNMRGESNIITQLRKAILKSVCNDCIDTISKTKCIFYSHIRENFERL